MVRAGGPIDFNLTYEMIERRRDRIRQLGNMLITISGILIPISFGLIIFTKSNQFFQVYQYVSSVAILSLYLLLASMILFLSSTISCVWAIFLKPPEDIRDKLSIINSISASYVTELFRIKISFVQLILDLIFLVVSGVLILIAGDPLAYVFYLYYLV